MHQKVTIISSLDRDSLHTMAFLLIVLHIPCFKPTYIASLNILYILINSYIFILFYDIFICVYI